MSKTERPVGPRDGSEPDARDAGKALPPERLLRINRLATEARFVSGLAHELNNSLQIMGGLVELLIDRPDLPADVRMRLTKIGDQADRAGAVIRQVLAYSRPEAHERRTIDLAAIIDRAVALRRYQLGRLGVELTWDATAAPRLAVQGDERQLQQVFLNLIVNAEEALEASRDRRLTIRIADEGDRVRCEVADSGPGIPADLRVRLFEPFVTTRRSGRNLGLGLSAAAAIVADHGGRLELADAPSGATFAVDLPRAKKSAGAG